MPALHRSHIPMLRRSTNHVCAHPRKCPPPPANRPFARLPTRWYFLAPCLKDRNVQGKKSGHWVASSWSSTIARQRGSGSQLHTSCHVSTFVCIEHDRLCLRPSAGGSVWLSTPETPDCAFECFCCPVAPRCSGETANRRELGNTQPLRPGTHVTFSRLHQSARSSRWGQDQLLMFQSFTLLT